MVKRKKRAKPQKPRLEKSRTKKKKKRGSEKSHNELVSMSIKLLKENGIYAWRIESKPMPVKSHGKIIWVSRAPEGFSDILAIRPESGRMIAIEVKTGRSKLREAQVKFKEIVENNNGEFYVVRSLDDIGKIVVKDTKENK